MEKTKEMKGIEWKKGERVTSSELARLDSEYKLLTSYLKALADEGSVEAVDALKSAGSVAYTFNERVKGAEFNTISAKMVYKRATKNAAECLELKRNCSKLVISLADTSKVVAVKGNVVSTVDKLDSVDSAYAKRDRTNFSTWLNERRIGEQIVSTYVDRLVKKYQSAINALRTSLEVMDTLPTVEGFQIAIAA